MCIRASLLSVLSAASSPLASLSWAAMVPGRTHSCQRFPIHGVILCDLRAARPQEWVLMLLRSASQREILLKQASTEPL